MSKLDEYLEILRVLDPHANMLSVKDFPELKRYRESLKHLETETANMRMVRGKTLETVAVFYADIRKLHPWWVEVFHQGRGVAYVPQVDSFFFGDPGNEGEKPLWRMKKFVKALKERGWL